MMIFVSTGIVLCAQQPGGGWRNFEPDQMAERQTASMIRVLHLSDAQAEKIREVNLKYALQMDSLRKSNERDFSAMRDQMMVLRSAQSSEQKKYLTGAQFEKWQKYTEEQRNNRSQRRRPGKNDQGKKSGNSSPGE